ncbi:MAG: Rrf2 family transcriptional regulator [Bdellovibrionaceae bacterium]|nr:Rrf2 family transcriptional regulator [Pseudobdellovibrionaceae bacterium]
MNKINRKLEYALIGLKHMRSKQPGELTTVKEIAATYGCPFEATSKVMQSLAAGGLVRSEQGAHGGYQLVRDLNRLPLYEVLEMVVGPVEIAKCLHQVDGGCELRGSCNVISPIENLNRKLIEFYRGLTVGELLEGRGFVAKPQSLELRDLAAHAGHELAAVE